jgi:cytochrome c
MKSLGAILTLVLCLMAASAANATISDADAAKLMTKYNCQACHTVDKKLVGPAFRDVAKKHAADTGAQTLLEGKVKNGSTGAWGPIPMPPNSVPAEDLTSLVQWILALK